MQRKNGNRGACMNILLITGASSDLGMELLGHVAGRYDFVWAHYHQMNDRLMQLCREFSEKIGLLQADFLEEADVVKMTKEMAASGKIPNHIVHLPAEKYMLCAFHRTDWEVYERNLAVSVRSAAMILREVLPRLARTDDGRVIFVLSECTCGDPPAYTAHYTMTKYALLGLLRTLSVEYEKKGIMINGISPGMMETKFLDGVSRLVAEKNARQNPSGKNISPAELMDVFEMLLFGGCRISGQNIAVKSL